MSGFRLGLGLRLKLGFRPDIIQGCLHYLTYTAYEARPLYIYASQVRIPFISSYFGILPLGIHLPCPCLVPYLVSSSILLTQSLILVPLVWILVQFQSPAQSLTLGKTYPSSNTSLYVPSPLCPPSLFLPISSKRLPFSRNRSRPYRSRTMNSASRFIRPR